MNFLKPGQDCNTEQKPHVETGGESKYESPKITFIPLKIEEKLMACGKTEADGTCGGALFNS